MGLWRSDLAICGHGAQWFPNCARFCAFDRLLDFFHETVLWALDLKTQGGSAKLAIVHRAVAARNESQSTPPTSSPPNSQQKHDPAFFVLQFHLGGKIRNFNDQLAIGDCHQVVFVPDRFIDCFNRKYTGKASRNRSKECQREQLRRLGLIGLCGGMACSRTSRRSENWSRSRLSPRRAAASFEKLIPDLTGHSSFVVQAGRAAGYNPPRGRERPVPTHPLLSQVPQSAL